MLFADGIVNALALGRDPSHEIEEERPARQRVIEGVVTVYAFQAHRLNEIGKIVVFVSGRELLRQRNGVAERQLVRIGHVLELAALVLKHPKVEVDVVCNEQRVAPEKLEESVERFRRRDA